MINAIIIYNDENENFKKITSSMPAVIVTDEIAGMKNSIVGVILVDSLALSILLRPFITYEKKIPITRSIPVHMDPATTWKYSR